MNYKNKKIKPKKVDVVLIEMEADLFLMDGLRYVGTAKNKPVPKSAEQVVLEKRIKQRKSKKLAKVYRPNPDTISLNNDAVEREFGLSGAACQPSIPSGRRRKKERVWQDCEIRKGAAVMENKIKEFMASLAALVVLAIYVIFHFVYVSVFLTFIVTGLLVLLARSVGANTESEGYRVLIFLTSLLIYAKAVDGACDRFNWRHEEQHIIESVRKRFGLSF